MAQEFFINSQNLEDQVRKLLPSQGGAGAGFDLSASTQIIPIIDLTESAEGSNIAQVLQTSSSFATENLVSSNNDVLLVSNTGYYLLRPTFSMDGRGGGSTSARIYLDDGASEKDLWFQSISSGGTNNQLGQVFPFVAFISAGKTLRMATIGSNAILNVSFQQIASIDGTLVSPI